MLKKTILYTLSLPLLLTLGGCRPDIEEIRPYTNTVGELNALLAQVPAATTTTRFTLSNLQHDTTLVTPGGLRIRLEDTDQLFAAANGAAVPCSSCAELELEVTEALRKGDVLARGLNTTSLAGDLLETGGIVHLRARCNGEELGLLPGRTVRVQIPVPANQLRDDLIVGHATHDGDENFTGWTLTAEPVYTATWIAAANPNETGYELYPDRLGWVGAFRTLNEPSTTFCVSLPAPHTAENSIVILSIKNLKTVVLPAADGPTGATFCFEPAPLGYPVRILVVSKYQGQYWLGERDTEIGTNATVSVSPLQKLEQQVLNALQNL